jgi:PKD repeat protein
MASSNKSFTVDKTLGFSPLTVKFDASGISGIKSAKKFYWNFGNGVTQIGTTAIVVFNIKLSSL